jgi:ribonuclease HI
LFFADDSLLFCRANFTEWGRLLGILSWYEKASGQKLNAAKTSIFFSKNTGAEFKDFLRSSAGISTTSSYDKYLGLPALVGRSKNKTFAGIEGRVRKKMDGWKEKFLSQAGKEILIKAVVQAIPTYSMSVFQLPKKLCNSLNSLVSRFWWGQNYESKRVQWMSWTRLGVSKFQGGMGFWDLEVFNKALLAKQGWRLMKFPNSLFAQILQDKYYPKGDFLKARVGRRPSYAWRSIVQAREVLERGIAWRVGNGELIRIWGDKWLPPPQSRLIHHPLQGLACDARVSELIDPHTRWWNYDLIRTIFEPWEAGQICNLVLSPLGHADQIVWQGTKHGLFSVKSAYHLEMQHRNQSRGESSKTGQEERIWKTLWNLNVPPVVKHFAWKVIHKVKAIIEDFDGANAKMEKERRLLDPGRVRWHKPPVGILKINWDAALHKGNKHMGVGVVIQDDKGDVVGALSKIVPYIVDPLTAETMAVWHAARWACEMDFQNVIMEGDSPNVIQELQKQDSIGSVCGQLIMDTKTILSRLVSVSFQHVKMDANKVAHCLAKFALSQMLDKVWVEDCPPIIQPIVFAEQGEDY